MVLEPGLTPEEVAELFYKAIESNDFERYKETIISFYREQLEKDIRGTNPEFWWDSGRRYVEEYGVSWHFHEVSVQNDNYAKLFFKRIQGDGSQRGMPLPIHLEVDIDGEWRVKTATV